MEFRRINGLPPYVFATINDLKALSRRAGRDVIDLGFGNPDLPSPDVAVNKLAEAAHNPRNHRYSASRGIPKLRSGTVDRQQHGLVGSRIAKAMPGVLRHVSGIPRSERHRPV